MRQGRKRYMRRGRVRRPWVLNRKVEVGGGDARRRRSSRAPLGILGGTSPLPFLARGRWLALATAVRRPALVNLLLLFLLPQRRLLVFRPSRAGGGGGVAAAFCDATRRRPAAPPTRVESDVVLNAAATAAADAAVGGIGAALALPLHGVQSGGDYALELLGLLHRAAVSARSR